MSQLVTFRFPVLGSIPGGGCAGGKNIDISPLSSQKLIKNIF